MECDFKKGDKVIMISGFNDYSNKYVGIIGTIEEIEPGRARPNKWITWIKYPDGKRVGPYSENVRHVVYNNQQAASLLRRD